MADWCVLIASTGLTNFSNEGLDSRRHRAGQRRACCQRHCSVYRAFRKQTQVDTPNHRYSISAAAYQRCWCVAGPVEGVLCVEQHTRVRARARYRPGCLDRCAVPRVGRARTPAAAIPTALVR